MCNTISRPLTSYPTRGDLLEELGPPPQRGARRKAASSSCTEHNIEDKYEVEEQQHPILKKRADKAGEYTRIQSQSWNRNRLIGQYICLSMHMSPWEAVQFVIPELGLMLGEDVLKTEVAWRC